MSAKFLLNPMICFFAFSFLIVPASALTPAELADHFHARGVAAEARGEPEVAGRCYELALRASPGHRATREKLAALGKKRAEELLALGTAAEAKGALQAANLNYVLALHASPGHAEAEKKVSALKKKMGADFKEGGELIIREKLRRIIIPRIDFEDTTVEEAVDFLRLSAHELDEVEPDPAKKGVNFVIRKLRGDDGGPADPGSLRIDQLSLRNVPLAEALKYICDKTRLLYKVDEYSVTLVPFDKEPPLLVRKFQVTPDFVSRLAGPAADPFADRSSRWLRSKFGTLGLSFADDSSVVLNEKNELHLKGEADLLKRAEEVIAKLGGRPLGQDGAPIPAARPAAPMVDAIPAWTSKDGKTIRADFVGLDGQAVVVRREGKEVTIPFARLSPASVAQARAFGDVAKDVLLHYDFSDGSGTTVADRSGKGRHGTLHGFADTNAGAGDTSPSGWAKAGILRFDGADDYVSTPLAVADFEAGAYTLEAVVSHSDPKRSWGPIIAVDAKDGRAPGAVDLGKVGSGGSWTSPPTALCSRHNGSRENATISTRPTSICDGRLHHVAAVFDREHFEIRLYFDHLLVERERIDGSSAQDPFEKPRLGDLHFLIGANGWAPSERWLGPISEVRITKRALSPALFLPNPNPLTAKPPLPKHRWSFSGDLKDSIGGADGKMIDPGQPTARFADGMLNLAGNRGEASAAPVEDAHVDLPNGLVKGAGGRISFEIWCTPSKWAENANILRFERGDVEGMTATDRSGSYRDIGLAPRSVGNNLAGFVEVVYKRNHADADFDLPEGKEHHFVLILDPRNPLAGPSGTLSLFLDGYLAATAALPAGFLDELEDNNNWLGRGSADNPMFCGLYNEFRIYDKALTADEVLASYLAGPDAIYSKANPAGGGGGK